MNNISWVEEEAGCISPPPRRGRHRGTGVHGDGGMHAFPDTVLLSVLCVSVRE